jgi:signal transduction histidine kinase
VTPRSGKGFASGVVSLPMLLECDRHGQVIWLSEPIRSVVGAPRTLAEILEFGAPHSKIRFHLFPVLQAPEGMILGAETENRAAPGGMRQPSALRHLELKLLYAYFRLHKIERRLSRHAARRRRGGGRIALRQIELERQRLGNELHTGVGQMLAAIRLQLEIVNTQIVDPPATVRQALDNIAALAEQALIQVRAISRRLHPPEWQRLTLESALQQLWDMSGIPLAFEARLDLQPLGREPEPAVKTLFYRMAQEGLSNIIGHSKARKVSMSLQSRGDTLSLTVEDDGIGFDAATLTRRAPNLAGGIGLQSLLEQANGLGAKFDVESGTNGTKLFLSARFLVDPER